jgi:hypothetical protein
MHEMRIHVAQGVKPPDAGSSISIKKQATKQNNEKHTRNHLPRASRIATDESPPPFVAYARRMPHCMGKRNHHSKNPHNVLTP